MLHPSQRARICLNNILIPISTSLLLKIVSLVIFILERHARDSSPESILQLIQVVVSVRLTTIVRSIIHVVSERVL